MNTSLLSSHQYIDVNKRLKLLLARFVQVAAEAEPMIDTFYGEDHMRVREQLRECIASAEEVLGVKA